MKYSAPEIVVLDDAAHAIQGSKQPPLESNGELQIVADCELDD